MNSANDRVNILLVDDQPSNLEVLESVLENPEYNFVRALTADEALRALLHTEFAAIVLDIRMPEMNGIELAKLIKGRRRTQHIPILFLTAHLVDDTDILRGYGVGAVDYLSKPLNPDILRSKVGVFIDLFRKTRALEAANRALESEIAERKLAQEALCKANEELESRVGARTADLVRLNQFLSENDKHRNEFLATLAHELRNPLAPIANALHLIRMAQGDAAVVDQSAAMIERQLKNLVHLVEDLIDVARITAGKIELRRGRVELKTVLESAVETSRPVIESGKHRVSLSLPSQRVFVDADQTRLAQVFANLLNNAAKYSQDGATIDVTAGTEGDEVVVKVKDSGAGIAPEIMPYIFDLFTQGDRVHGDRYGGLGVGLSIVKRIVQLHGGAVTAHSEGRGKGSEFTIRLAAAAEAPGGAPKGNPAAGVPPGRFHGRIVVADDNRDAAESLAAVLRLTGNEVRTAFDGEEAFAAVESFRPDVAILDIGMPKLDGYDLARRIRAQPWSKGMHLIALTGWGQPLSRERSAAAGFNDHLVKPLDPETLRATLNDTACHRREAQSDEPPAGRLEPSSRQ